MPTSLVTGGAGFIGVHVVNQLIAMGHRLVVIDDLSGGFRENVNPEAGFVDGCITDAAFVDSLFAEHRFDYGYHLAAYAAEGLSHFIRRFNYTNNAVGTMTLVNTVRLRVNDRPPTPLAQGLDHMAAWAKKRDPQTTKRSR